MKDLIEEMRADFLRFLPSPESLDLEECWLWRGAVDRFGCGVYQCEGRDFQIHRSAAILFGERAILSKMEVYHTGDNLLCCNPCHLRIRDNVSRHTYDCMGIESLIPTDRARR